MTVVVKWYDAVERAVPYPESYDVVQGLAKSRDAREAVAAAWALGQHAAVRGAVLSLLEGTDLRERVAAAYERLRQTDPQDVRVST